MSDIHNLTFTNRETYLVWRAAWRVQYRELSLSIRANKAKAARLSKNGEDASITQMITRRQSFAAFALMETRMASKQRSREQYAQRIALIAA